MIPKSMYTNENITKISTLSPILPYLQDIIINNKPLTPILILNIYMPMHLQDTHFVLEIQNQILILMSQYPNHQTTLIGDFNRDILLKGRTNNDILTPPNPIGQEWAHFTQNNGLDMINNPKTLTRQ